MKLKHTILTLAAAGMLSAQAYAGEAPIEALQPAQAAAVMGEPAAAAFTPAEMAALFEQNGQPMQLAALSSQEMQETEGARLAPGALGIYGIRIVGGALIGGVSNAWNHHANTGQWSWGAFGRGAVAGAAGGAFAGWLKIHNR